MMTAEEKVKVEEKIAELIAMRLEFERQALDPSTPYDVACEARVEIRVLNLNIESLQKVSAGELSLWPASEDLTRLAELDGDITPLQRERTGIENRLALLQRERKDIEDRLLMITITRIAVGI